MDERFVDVYAITDIDSLHQLLKHTDWWVRSGAANQLSFLNAVDSIPNIEAAIEIETTRDARRGFREALRKLRKQPFDPLNKLLFWDD